MKYLAQGLKIFTHGMNALGVKYRLCANIPMDILGNIIVFVDEKLAKYFFNCYPHHFLTILLHRRTQFERSLLDISLANIVALFYASEPCINIYFVFCLRLAGILN